MDRFVHLMPENESTNKHVRVLIDDYWKYRDKRIRVMKEMGKLTKEEWDTLDELLRKVGFGGYYDCIQLLKDAIYKLEPKLQGKLEKLTDFFSIVHWVYRLASKE